MQILAVCVYLCNEKILLIWSAIGSIWGHAGIGGLHLLALGCDVSRGLYKALSSVVMLVQLLSEPHKHVVEAAWRTSGLLAGSSRVIALDAHCEAPMVSIGIRINILYNYEPKLQIRSSLELGIVLIVRWFDDGRGQVLWRIKTCPCRFERPLRR